MDYYQVLSLDSTPQIAKSTDTPQTGNKFHKKNRRQYLEQLLPLYYSPHENQCTQENNYLPLNFILFPINQTELQLYMWVAISLIKGQFPLPYSYTSSI